MVTLNASKQNLKTTVEYSKNLHSQSQQTHKTYGCQKKKKDVKCDIFITHTTHTVRLARVIQRLFSESSNFCYTVPLLVLD